eukprot:gene5571-11212_t
MFSHVTSFFKKKEDCTNFYKMGRILGQGSFATVRLCTCKADGTKWAIKIIKRKSLAQEDEAAILTEIKILQTVDHPNIVRLKEVYDSKSQMFIVMEVMYGGELFDRIVHKEHYTEQEAKQAFKHIIAAVGYCHDMDVVHRDLKPENLLYDSVADNAVLKLADFGLAQLLKPNEMMYSTCGTPVYVAPEILRSGRGGMGYGKEVDMWSVGIILYIILCGFPPFYDEDHVRLFAAIQKGQFDFPSPYWDNVSEDAKDLIKNLLIVDPSKRLTASQTVQHIWVSQPDTCVTELPFFNENMKQFNARRRLRHAIRAVQILHRMHTKGFDESSNDVTSATSGIGIEGGDKLQPCVRQASIEEEGEEEDVQEVVVVAAPGELQEETKETMKEIPYVD